MHSTVVYPHWTSNESFVFAKMLRYFLCLRNLSLWDKLSNSKSKYHQKLVYLYFWMNVHAIKILSTNVNVIGKVLPSDKMFDLCNIYFRSKQEVARHLKVVALSWRYYVICIDVSSCDNYWLFHISAKKSFFLSWFFFPLPLLLRKAHSICTRFFYMRL